MPPQPEASTLTVACFPEDYSASHLARAVEDTDAHLINLNVTDRRLPDGRITVELRTNRRHSGATVRSLERYGYEVLSNPSDPSDPSDPSSDFSASLRLRASEVLHLINI